MGKSSAEYRVVPAGLFKATCLQLMDEVFGNKSLIIIVTKYGKPVAQLTAPPPGLKLTGPAVQLDELPVAMFGPIGIAAREAVERLKVKAKKDKKKRKDKSR